MEWGSFVTICGTPLIAALAINIWIWWRAKSDMVSKWAGSLLLRSALLIAVFVPFWEVVHRLLGDIGRVNFWIFSGVLWTMATLPIVVHFRDLLAQGLVGWGVMVVDLLFWGWLVGWTYVFAMIDEDCLVVTNLWLSYSIYYVVVVLIARKEFL